MKLLGWMHNKFWQNGIEPIKDFTIANSCIGMSPLQATVDDEDFYLKPSVGSRPLQLHNKDNNEKPCSEVEASNLLATSEDIDFFHGFLTIGTLGSEPATPTFSMAFENMIEMPDEVSEDDLKLINYEIEKFLEAETKEDWCDSPGRTSHASIITLTGKHIEGAEDENDGKILTCPLQEYLFASTVELSDKMIDMKNGKATSAAELFQQTATTNENSKEKIEKRVIQVKQINKTAQSFVKKMFKKLHISSHGSRTGKAADSSSTKKKLQKILSMFNRKIHPENSPDEKAREGYEENNLENVSSADNHNTGSLMNQGEDKIPFCQEFTTKQEMNYWKNNLDSNVSRPNKGHWIKTDADYLVLEL